MTRSLLRRLVPAALAATLAVPAFAQDAPAGPGKTDAPPAKPAEEAKPAKTERRVDEKAQKLIDAYGRQLHVAGTAGVKDLSCRIEMPMPQFGGEVVVIRPKWSAKDGYRCTSELPEVFAQLVPPEQLEVMRKSIDSQFGQITRAFLEGPVGMVDEYDVVYTEEGVTPVVVLTPRSEKASSERQRLFFGSNGLLEKSVMTPKVDPNDPSAAMWAGADIEIQVKHEKRGERWIVSGSTVSTPLGVMEMTTTYWDGPDGLPLPKKIAMTNPMTEEPLQLSFFDYVLDGKALEATRKPEPKPATPAAPATPSAPPTDAPKQGDASKQADAPKQETPPAPDGGAK